MADIVDKHTRSRMMSRIRGRDTTPELKIRKLLHGMGFRYRTHVSTLPGRPDLVFPKYGAVVFVHGCFWHRHEGCRFATTPSSNAEFWERKFAATLARDAVVVKRLREEGWRIATVWECELERNPERPAQQVARWLRSKTAMLEIPRLRKRGN